MRLNDYTAVLIASLIVQLALLLVFLRTYRKASSLLRRVS